MWFQLRNMLDSENSGLRDLRQAMLTTEETFDDFREFNGISEESYKTGGGPYFGMFRQESPAELNDPDGSIRI